MTYLEAVEFIHKIEREYDVMSIRYKGVKVWSYLRLYLLDKLSANREFQFSSSVVSLVLRCLFSYNPFQVFKRHHVWLLTGCERRKRLGAKMVQRVSGAIPTTTTDYLMIEKPSRGIGHYKRGEIEESNIVSESWLLMLIHLIELLSRPFTPKVQNEGVLQCVLKENNLDFDYRHYLHLLNAQRLSMKILMKIAGKPKIVFMESPYDSMGYMWAFHEAGVKVIEMQHGVLNKNHNAYNAIDYELKMNPDCICVFGEEEYKYFSIEKPQYAPKVAMTGLYMLERADTFFTDDIFAEERKAFNQIIVVSGQANAEKELSEFVDKVAASRTDLLFVYIPRHDDEQLFFSSRNVRLVTNVNIYEYLKWADVHMTISSTTCLEAHYYHTPTIFVNYNNLAKEYYGHILGEKEGAEYITREDEFDDALMRVSSGIVEWKELFAHNHTERIKKVVDENL